MKQQKRDLWKQQDNIRGFRIYAGAGTGPAPFRKKLHRPERSVDGVLRGFSRFSQALLLLRYI